MTAHAPEPDYAAPTTDDLERALLATCMTIPTAIAPITTLGLTPPHFAAERHAALWTALTHLARTGQGIDPLTAANAIPPRDLARYGGIPWIATLAPDATTPPAARAHAERIIDHATARALTRAGHEIIAAGDHPGDLDHRIHAARAAIQHVADARARRTLTDDTALAAAREADAAIDQAAATPLGLRDLDDALDGGLGQATLNLIGARPAVGKTALSLEITRRTAAAGRRVLYLSLEMTRADLLTRMASAASGVPYRAIRRHHATPMPPVDRQAVTAALKHLATQPILIPPSTSMTVEQAIAHLDHHHHDTPLDLVIIDHVGLLTPTRGTGDSPVRQIAHISRELKNAALRTNVPILALTQLNRASAREERKPVLTDLRDSGSLEQDADVVLLLHRHLDPTTGDPTTLDILIAKNRRGPVTRATLAFDGTRQRVNDQ